MKIIYLFVLSSVLALGSLHAAGGKSEYQKAVDSYINAATLELEAIHEKLDALSTKIGVDAESGLKSLKKDLGDCEQLLKKLKEADSSNFDAIKAQYELSKHAVMQEISEMQAKQG